MKVSKANRLTAFLLSLVFLSACGGLTQSDKPAISTWWLKPYESNAPAATGEGTRLSVELTVIPGLDTDRILILSTEAELTHYAGARWADNTPELLASLVGRSLQASGRFDVIPSSSGNAAGECKLRLEVQEFFVKADSSGTTGEVQVMVHGRYGCDTGESVPIHQQVSIPVNGNRISTVVNAFQRATDALMVDLLGAL
jgi:cholesterol transport system auxiliary component